MPRGLPWGILSLLLSSSTQFGTGVVSVPSAIEQGELSAGGLTAGSRFVKDRKKLLKKAFLQAPSLS